MVIDPSLKQNDSADSCLVTSTPAHSAPGSQAYARVHAQFLPQAGMKGSEWHLWVCVGTHSFTKVPSSGAGVSLWEWTLPVLPFLALTLNSSFLGHFVFHSQLVAPLDRCMWCPHSLGYLTIWSPGGGTIWRGAGGSGLWGFKHLLWFLAHSPYSSRCEPSVSHSCLHTFSVLNNSNTPEGWA